MVAAYTGNGAYCFSNSLHMSLLAAGADPLTLPETWFIECLTAMPFGRFFSAAGPSFGINAPGWRLERQALPLAIEALGWRCETRHGGPADEALARLRDGLARGPAMLGPLDFRLPLVPPRRRRGGLVARRAVARRGRSRADDRARAARPDIRAGAAPAAHDPGRHRLRAPGGRPAGRAGPGSTPTVDWTKVTDRSA
ncbi:MAG TPA: hypothetical protein VGL23_08475 [Chloroflexota bacterium]|jgi:hypothetical protein